MFKRCCGNRKEIDYKIEHSPRPIKLSDDMDTVIKNLLWYTPNIDSYQSDKNELISDKIYDEFSFTYVMNQMGMDESRDAKWIGSKDVISNDEWKFFEENICSNCQKIIVAKYTTFSKINALLTAIRNCIAHGHFAIVEDYIIGFNKKFLTKDPDGLKKSVIKIKPKPLLTALEKLTSPIGKELLLAYAFRKVGYDVQEPKNRSRDFDLCLEKNGKKYVIEIKSYRGNSYLHPEHVEIFLKRAEKALPGVERILLIDTSRVTKSVRQLESKIKGFRIVDINDVKLLLGEELVDILAR
jgi:hypothetical protein